MLLEELPEPAESVEYRISLPEDNFKQVGDEVLGALSAFAEKHSGWSAVKDNREGIRIAVDENNGDGWFLLRMSVHDPVMPLNIESNKKGGCEKIAEEFKKFLSRFPQLSI
jgi:phosphomannomutase